MRLGFLNQQIDERGTWQTYLYAKHVQRILGHSVVILFPSDPYLYGHSIWTRVTRTWACRLSARRKAAVRCYDAKIADRITRDGVPIVETRLDANFGDFDAIYHQKYGMNDGFRPRSTRYCVHAVFDASQPHGDRFAAVSSWLGRKHNVPFVPHIVEVADDSQNLRRELNIPSDAVVLGRFGGRNTFDIPWTWEAIANLLKARQSVYFLFANTDVKIQHERVISLPTIYDGEISLEVQKRRFINTCDVMLHVRERGETFGIAVGEFAVCGKPVLTYGKSRERSHIEMLRQPALYNDAAELKRCLEMAAARELPPEDGGAYRDCTPEKVVKAFEQVFFG